MTVDSHRDDLLHETGSGESTADPSTKLTAEDIEAAYARALEAMSAVELAIPELAGADSVAEAQTGDESESYTASILTDGEAGPIPAVSDNRLPNNRKPHDPEPLVSSGEQVIQPQQVIEAALFVGGDPLTAKRLAIMIGQESDGEEVDLLIAGLNEQYHHEERPYEVRLLEGGYRLTLREDFETVRDRVYGRNPKEVKLSQEALEVLAFVAYRQPVRCEDIEEAGKANAAAVLRQLLRRQLVSLHRSDEPSDDVTYSTSPRFLELFGLRHLDELPLPDDLALK